jgi:hypothetical protein
MNFQKMIIKKKRTNLPKCYICDFESKLLRKTRSEMNFLRKIKSPHSIVGNV